MYFIFNSSTRVKQLFSASINLLGELRAEESVPNILETFSQDEEFIEFWFGDFITGYLWEPLYFMGNGPAACYERAV